MRGLALPCGGQGKLRDNTPRRQVEQLQKALCGQVWFCAGLTLESKNLCSKFWPGSHFTVGPGPLSPVSSSASPSPPLKKRGPSK